MRTIAEKEGKERMGNRRNWKGKEGKGEEINPSIAFCIVRYLTLLLIYTHFEIFIIIFQIVALQTVFFLIYPFSPLLIQVG